MNPMKEHMLFSLFNAFLAGDYTATEYDKDGKRIRTVVITEIKPETGVIQGYDNSNGKSITYNINDCFLLSDKEEEPSLPIAATKEGFHVYQVPFAYEKYGYIPVAAKSLSEAKEAAQVVLDNMAIKDMEKRSIYLEDSAELDIEGMVLDRYGKIIEEE